MHHQRVLNPSKAMTCSIEIQAILMSRGHQNSLLENGVSCFSLESEAGWETMTESEGK